MDFIKTNLFKLLAGALLVFVLGIVGYSILSQTYNAGFKAGNATTEAKWRIKYTELQQINQQLTEQVSQQQHTLDTQSAYFERRSHEEQQNIIADYERRLAAVNNRVERVYIPAKPRADYCDRAIAAAAGASLSIREERCELDPATYEHLASIARDGDIAIIERNELIDRYNAARAALIALQQHQSSTKIQRASNE